jgi:hypothetical protein
MEQKLPLPRWQKRGRGMVSSDTTTRNSWMDNKLQGGNGAKSNFSSSLFSSPIQKNSDIGGQMLKNLSSSLHIPFPLFLHGLKLPLHPLYKGNLSSTPC